MPLFLVRHGSTKLNQGDSDTQAGHFRGWVDEPLSPNGEKAAQATGNWFKNKKVSLVVTSDLARARDTAHAIGKTAGAPVIEDPRLRPWNIGDLSGQKITPQRLKLSERLQKESPEEPAPGGESYNQFLERYGSVLQELVQASSNHTVVAVAHHRNALAASHLVHGTPTRTKGPPEPGGVIQLTAKGIKQVYTPASERRIADPNSNS